MSNKQQALWQQGQRHTQMKQWRQAAAAYEAILDHDRTFLPAWLELSTAHEALDGYRAAQHAVLEAARMTRVPPMAALAVARRLRRFERLPELQRYVDETGVAGQLPPEKLLDLVTFFASAGDHARTLGWVQYVLKMRPDLAEAHNVHGLALMIAGQDEASAAAFERALAIRPTFTAIYAVLARVAKATPERNHVDALRRLLAQPNLSTRDEAYLGYALHTELHDLGEYDDAWEALARGSRARRKDAPYDHAATLAMFDTLKRMCDAGFVRGEPVEEGPTPIFIVGLHRSGTTLLERILAGHPDVADAGETYAFPAQLRWQADHFCGVVADQVIIERSPGFDYPAVARGFLASMRARAGGKPYITEKQNPNFILAGHIARALPQARILHMRRAPADVCFSNLRTLFTNEAAYSNDQVEMADFYAAYRGLMDHWREVMPDRLFDIDYDTMVAEPEAEARRVAAHCGLAFQPSMLDLGRQTGMVTTASSHQVRQGIVKTRGGLWRNYERHLGPMLDRLAHHGFA